MDLQTEMSVSKGRSKKIDSCYKPENRNSTNTTILAADETTPCPLQTYSSPRRVPAHSIVLFRGLWLLVFLLPFRVHPRPLRIASAADGCNALLASSPRYSDRPKPLLDDLNVFNEIRPDAELQLLQLFREESPVDEIDRWGTVSGGFPTRLQCETACAEDDALVCATNHGTSKISDAIGADIPFMPLALKQDVEANETAQSDRSIAVDSTVSASLRDLDLDESGLSENPLAQTFERDRI